MDFMDCEEVGLVEEVEALSLSLSLCEDKTVKRIHEKANKRIDGKVNNRINDNANTRINNDNNNDDDTNKQLNNYAIRRFNNCNDSLQFNWREKQITKCRDNSVAQDRIRRDNQKYNEKHRRERREKIREYNRSHKEYFREYYQSHREQACQYFLEYCTSHREQRFEYYQSHREQLLERVKLYNIPMYLEVIKKGPTNLCISRCRLLFDHSMTTLTYSRILDKCSLQFLEKVCPLQYDVANTVELGNVCSNRRLYLLQNKIPPLSLALEELRFPNIPPELQELNMLEERFLAPRIAFIQIKTSDVINK